MKKEQTINVFAESNYGTRIQITITKEGDDLIDLINKAINEIKEFEKGEEKFKIVHIDSIGRQKIPEL